MNQPSRLPSPEALERQDGIHRRQWREAMAMSYLINLDSDTLIQIVSEGLGVWLQFARPQQQKHAMHERDMIWIFSYIRNHLAKRKKVVEEIAHDASRPFIFLTDAPSR